MYLTSLLIEITTERKPIFWTRDPHFLINTLRKKKSTFFEDLDALVRCLQALHNHAEPIAIHKLNLSLRPKSWIGYH